MLYDFSECCNLFLAIILTLFRNRMLFMSWKEIWHKMALHKTTYLKDHLKGRNTTHGNIKNFCVFFFKNKTKTDQTNNKLCCWYFYKFSPVWRQSPIIYKNLKKKYLYWRNVNIYHLEESTVAFIFFNIFFNNLLKFLRMLSTHI